MISCLCYMAKSITLEDPIEELGVQLVKQAAIKTADNAGDGTTTSTLLAQEIVSQGLKELSNDRNAVQLKREIDTAVKQVLDAIRTEIKEDVSSEDQLKQIATISANNDPEVGELIGDNLYEIYCLAFSHLINLDCCDSVTKTLQ